MANILWTPKNDPSLLTYWLYADAKNDPFPKYVYENSGVLTAWKDVASQTFFYPYASAGFPRYNEIKQNNMGLMTLHGPSTNREYFEATNGPVVRGSNLTLFSVFQFHAGAYTSAVLWALNSQTSIFGVISSFPMIMQLGGIRYGHLTSLLADVWYIMCFASDAVSSEVFINGTKLSSPSISSGLLNLTASTVRLGASLASTPPPADDSMAAEFAEKILYQRRLSPAEIQRVTGYLAWKWNLQNMLPQGHQYKSFPPVVAGLNAFKASSASRNAASLWHNY
jgi:hypothetical protein